MVECGSIKEAPSCNHMTVWGIVEIICMGIAGIFALRGIIYMFINNSYISIITIISLIGYILTFAAMIFMILSLVKNSSAKMKSCLTLFLLSAAIAIFIIVYYLIGGYFRFLDLIYLCFEVFIVIIIINQLKNFS